MLSTSLCFAPPRLAHVRQHFFFFFRLPALTTMKAFLPLSAMLLLAAAMYQEDQEDQNQTSERERIEIGATIPDESIQAEMGGMIKGVNSVPRPPFPSRPLLVFS